MPEGFAMLQSRRQKIEALVFGADSFLAVRSLFELGIRS